MTALIRDFQTKGPKLSGKKSSTLAPSTMSEDDILIAGDQTAETQATLIRYESTNNIPVSGTQISTMHQKIIHNIVWIVLKDNVTYTKSGGSPTLTGGKVTSSFPTSDTAIPADPVIGIANGLRYGPLQ